LEYCKGFLILASFTKLVAVPLQLFYSRLECFAALSRMYREVKKGKSLKFIHIRFKKLIDHILIGQSACRSKSEAMIGN